MSWTERGQVLMARAVAWYAALPPKRRERVQDTGLAVVLAVMDLLSLVPYRSQLHPAWVAFFLVAMQCLALTWRRACPVVVLILAGIPRNVYDLMGFGFAPLPLATAVAFATVADRSSPLWRWLSLAGTAIGIGISQSAPGHDEPYEAIIQIFIFGTAWVIGVLNRSRRAVLAAASQRAERAEAELDAAAARAADAERVRIARELHDVVAHHVSLMAVQAEATGALLPERPGQASRSADLIADTARQALTELRRLLGVLRSPGDPSEATGLIPHASLTRLGDVLGQVRDSGLPVSLTVSGEPAELTPGIDLTAYRIVQEALTNTLRHSPGAQASVSISYAEDEVTINVRDTGAADTPGARMPDTAPVTEDRVIEDKADGDKADGDRVDGGRVDGGRVGRDGARLRPSPPHGFGLAGIAERVASCGGTLTVGPVPQGGFAVTARLPVR